MNYITNLSVTKEALELDVFITIEIGKEDKSVPSHYLVGRETPIISKQLRLFYNRADGLLKPL